MAQQNFEASAPENEPITSASDRRIAARKQGFNVYTTMLLLSLVFLVIGTVLLFLEVSKFPGGVSGGWNTSAATPTSATN